MRCQQHGLAARYARRAHLFFYGIANMRYYVGGASGDGGETSLGFRVWGLRENETWLALPAWDIAPAVGLDPHLQRKVLAEGKHGTVRDLDVDAGEMSSRVSPSLLLLAPTATRPGQGLVRAAGWG
jgi:hypothetical protein